MKFAFPIAQRVFCAIRAVWSIGLGMVLLLTSGGANAATLQATVVVTPTSVNLTSIGTGDWVHYGLTTASSVNRKAGVTQQISALNTSAAASRFTSSGLRPQMVWSGGTPTASASTRTGLYLSGAGNSYSFTLPADTTSRTASIYVGAYKAQGTLTLSLSDSSASPVSVVVDNPAGVIDRQVTVTYDAASAGATLQVQYVLTNPYTAGNITLQSVALTQAVSLPFSDDFNDGNANGWAFVDEVPNASAWNVVSSKLRQANRVESVFSFDESYHLGTLGYLVAGIPLKNYEFALTATYLGTGLQDGVGVLFRYRDPLNYYRLTLNGRYGFSRLEKQVNGVFTPLAVNARGYAPAQVLNIAVRVANSNIVTVVNGEEVFSVTDAAFSSGSVGMFTQDLAEFDNVSVTTLSSAPDVTLSSPVSHIAETGSQIAATASARNVPAGGRVEFLLDGTTSVSDFTEPYSAVFNSVTAGNHTVDAILRDSSNIELDRDTNISVGTDGNYLVAIGDSNTNGIGDNVASDNVSNLQKVIATGGYESRLTDLLDTSSAQETNLVFNEGIGGDDSFATLNYRVSSIRARHPLMDTALVLLGTNDALASIPSGLGCFGVACNGTFKGNMQAIIDRLRFDDYPTNTISSGIQVIVGKVLPAYNSTTPFNSTTNNRIRDYNSVIQTELSGGAVGPDLFGFFMSTASINYRSLFADTLHLNALGHNAMATLWHNVLKSPVAIPFLLGELSSTAATLPKQNLMEVGDTYTLDQSYILTAIPGALVNGRWVMLSDSNFTSTASNYVSFKVDRASTVYVAIDGGSTGLPGWMTGFSPSGASISSTNPQAPSYTLYQRTYAAASTVTLGGASAAPAAGVNANYVVIVVEN